MRSNAIILTAALLLCGAVWLVKPGRHPNAPTAADTVAVESVKTEMDSQLSAPLPEATEPQLLRSTNSVETLCDERKLQEAFALANNSDAENRDDQLRIVFSRWAQTNPEEAMQSLKEIADETTRTALFRIVADVWSANDPAKLANHVIALPSGDDREYAFSKATDNWSLQDPAAMGDWLNSLPASPEFDRAIAALLAKTDSENRSPQIAISWVDGINDPELRRKSLEVVSEQWAETDPGAAEKYVAGADWLTAEQRAQILHRLTESKKIAYEE